MKNILTHKSLLVKQSLIHGYGVFADEDISTDEIIEECYAILTHGGDEALRNYYFRGGNYRVVATGHGFIYNHNEDPNATYYFDEKTNLLIFKARRNIKKGEEILITYGNDWFHCRDMPIKSISWTRKIYRFFTGMPLRALVVLGGIYLLIELIKTLMHV